MGTAVLDESAITGEAAFIHKAVGSDVLSGTVVQNGYIEVTAKHEIRDSIMTKLNETVNDVQASKGRVGTIVDKFAAYWTPFILVVSALFAVIGGSVSGNWHGYINKSLVLLVLACPCSIVLAAPVAALSGIAAAAKHGVVIKGMTGALSLICFLLVLISVLTRLYTWVCASPCRL
jgi:Cd2+/Zn2+-exporting ATPase